MILADLIAHHARAEKGFADLAEGALRLGWKAAVEDYESKSRWHRDAVSALLRADRGYELIPLADLPRFNTAVLRDRKEAA